MSSTVETGSASQANLQANEPLGVRRWLLRVGRGAVQGLWLLLVPAALAWLVFELLFPNPFQARSGPFARALSELKAQQPILILVLLFLLFAWQARVWRDYLPLAKWAESQERPSTRAGRVAFGVLAALAILATLSFRASVLEPYRVVSASMLPTMRPGDWILVDKRAYGTRPPLMRYRFGASMPRRGDVVAFETPQELLGEPTRLVKRVIGLPGDRIDVDRGQVKINGWPIPLCDAGTFTYITNTDAILGRVVVEFLEQQAYLTVYFGTGAPFSGYTVTRGEVFVLGDNRNNSSDSRFWNGGSGGGLPLRAIEGRINSVLLASDDGRSNLRARMFQPLWRELEMHGVDTAALQTQIDRCLSEAPEQTTPPGPGLGPPRPAL